MPASLEMGSAALSTSAGGRLSESLALILIARVVALDALVGDGDVGRVGHLCLRCRLCLERSYDVVST